MTCSRSGTEISPRYLTEPHYQNPSLQNKAKPRRLGLTQISDELINKLKVLKPWDAFKILNAFTKSMELKVETIGRIQYVSHGEPHYQTPSLQNKAKPRPLGRTQLSDELINKLKAMLHWTKSSHSTNVPSPVTLVLH